MSSDSSMILTCPSCETRYNVAAGAIPEEGRMVRCAACGNKWHAIAEEAPAEDPVEEPTPEAPEAPGTQEASIAPPVAPAEPEAPVETEEPSLINTPVDPEVAEEIEAQAETQPAMVEEAEAVAAPEPVPVEDEPHHDMDFTGFEDEEEEESGPRRWPWLLLVLVLIAGGAAAFAYLAPVEWRQQLGLVAADVEETPLEIVLTRNNRSSLPSGNELVTVGGRVVNPTERTESVPPIRAELFDAEGQLLDSWTIAPPVEELGPGESASFNSAKDEAPANADEITLTLGG
ncbi:zinc-ribbon domain-containing protein [Sphingomicrobium sediminis]|uniref:Zinc-ribbon domain-containing protein n=1 Tax=Sphingomicrobium sediminis TaxID=2950949 RepID=A0A9X2J2T4_9SPHN|nr:zinc-ribbon domain-containing protein [Sphingomicrobium sediminis]MCM8558099.1 zinc-ribbon domain-containing protein [Sphingomicrobium sediminis]